MINKKELLFTQSYDVGEEITFFLYREEREGQVEVSLSYQFPQTEAITCKRFFYPAVLDEFESPYLSWYNLICCSNNYGPIPVVSYLNYAVQNHKKLAATIYPDTAAEYMQIIAAAKQDYYCFPFQVEEYAYMLFISRKGILADFFDIEQIIKTYTQAGIQINQKKLIEYFSKELSWFGTEDCLFDLHNCLGTEELIATGLLFGYPLASTAALINRTIDLCESEMQDACHPI